MITNSAQLEAPNRSLQSQQDLSFEKKLALLEGMYRLARELGQFTPDRSLEGIEHDIQLAASLRSLVGTTAR